jgi:aromatic ring-cleaving dioxygenase|tara:strand:- start:372 stop:716 length:345 start_codon:yes stop_codon:yes gene_type:complete
MSNYPVNSHRAYHAHIYFDEQSKALALILCEMIKAKFSLHVGTFHQRLVGPHTRWSCQISFGPQDFEEFIPWLDQHRLYLSILLHPLSGNDYSDHTKYCYWLGEPEPLLLDKLQ